MKKLSNATMIAVIAALLIATAAFAMFGNGNFETGDFTSWVKDTANKNGGILVGPPPSYVPSASSSVDDMFIVNTAWMNANFGAGVTCDPYSNGLICLPYAGGNSAVVNYLGKTGNLNRLTQSGLVAGGDVGLDGMFHIFFTYAPVLDKGTHSAADQPFMYVKLTRVRSGSPDQVLFDKFSYPDDGNPNWQTSPLLASVKFMPWQVYDLTYAPADLGPGDTLTLEVVAAGCVVTAGGHWGYVYVDEFGPTTPAGSTAPSISSLTPSSGPDTGGTSVTIVGSNFTGATAVSIGTSTLLAGSFTVVDDTHITFTTPANSAGIVDISVINPGGSAVYPSGFTYLAIPIPTISSIVPNSGPVTGGTTVVITGTDFTGATTFTFGGTAATCTVDSATQITCTSPAHSVGAVDVAITTPGGTATSTGGFTYFEVPTITNGGIGGGIAPNSGPTAGGTSVTISGANFTGTTSVTFGGTPANLAACTVTATSITCPTPAHVASPVDVVVTTPGGTATSTGGFTYFEVPTITNGGTGGGIAPNSGPTAGGTSVTISGANFTGTTSVTFGGTPANLVACTVTATSITCPTPAHPAGPVDVVVTTPGGTATSVGGFTYINAILTLTASGPATVYPGGQYTYAFAYTTTASVSNAQVAFNLPGHTTYASNTGGYVCNSAGGVVTCSLGTIAANGSFDVTVAVDKLKKISTPLTLATTAYSISASGVPAVNGAATVTANTLNPFTDVPNSDWALDYIQSVWAYGVTYGCAVPNPLTTYCPDQPVTRGEMAIFIERAVHTSAFNPGTPAITFTDTNSHFAKYWIEALKNDAITGGCGSIATFCPDSTIARVEMSVFLLRGQSWPAVHVPPASTGMWPDVPATHWGIKWADELGTSGISNGCGGGLFCPNNAVIRSEMAVLVQRTFQMTMPSP